MYVALFVLCLAAVAQANYKNPNTVDGRSAMVHLFEWPWKSIAEECENFLGPNGFGGVQISPPHEHRVIYEPSWDPNVKRPWYESYQPVSYKLGSRRGSREDLIDMVQRCNAAKVRIYVDGVVNHMCGEDAGQDYGSANSPFDTDTYDFPDASYTSAHFNVPCGNCKTGGNINTYNDAEIVRNCNLVGLLDLDTSLDHVRGRITAYLNDLIDIGVAGFRIDAAKHMWPDDLIAIFDMTNDLNTAYFPASTRPFFYQEVIDQDSGEAVTAGEYSGVARVTDFIYGKTVSEAFRDGGSNQISNFQSFGTWGVKLSDNDGLVFIDNHDNQRGHGGGGFLVTHKNGRYYTLAVAFMLAWPHGFPRIMSSYYFDQDWEGPPHVSDSDWSIQGPSFDSDGNCNGDWVCEHRWRPIKNMVEWRNQAGNEPVQNWWGDYQKAAFSRGNRAFIAINRDWSPINNRLQTGLPTGEYCNLARVDYDPNQNTCTGDETVVVDGSGYADIYVDNNDEDSLLLIHVGATKNGPIQTTTPKPGVTSTTTTSEPKTSNPNPQLERTVIFIQKQTVNGEDLFLRGGIDDARRSGCTTNAETSACAIPIYHLIEGSSNEKFSYWSINDRYLDWYGAEDEQGTYNGQAANGSPMVWTTNDANYFATVDTHGYGYTPLNQWGEHYWMLDIQMDCSETEQGWFELKSVVNGNWESDISQASQCGGSAGGEKLYSSGNHFARCGYLNVFSFGSGDCQIDNL
ncbi:alpha-amylase B-like [Diadema antillarum]|uniref:alpha-amylase B-like n=1 Tax=Diadema antillarum TaxID=105358 RepID=UPI003A85DA08